MNGVYNSELLTGIARGTFYRTLQSVEGRLVYPKLCEMVTQEDLTVNYTSFGGVPEPRQLSGSVASTGERQSKGIKDYNLAVTVVEWEQTVVRPRAVIETNPDEVSRITAEMAVKAQMYMDRYLIATVLPSTTKLGYDGLALYADAHAETGSNQDNNTTSDIVAAATPTAAEIELTLHTVVPTLQKFTDDQGTPVNAGVQRFTLLTASENGYRYRNVLDPNLGQRDGLDIAGGAGTYRGMFDVVPTPFQTDTDRFYLFAEGDGVRKAVACFKNKDFEFKTNIGTDSDLWNLKEQAVFSSYARFEFMPWNWKSTVRHVFTTT